jgi:hypothetical protein
VAGDCLLTQPLGGLLTRKLPLNPAESAAIYDPPSTDPHIFLQYIDFSNIQHVFARRILLASIDSLLDVAAIFCFLINARDHNRVQDHA